MNMSNYESIAFISEESIVQVLNIVGLVILSTYANDYNDIIKLVLLFRVSTHLLRPKLELYLTK